jgi:hypothetical protein
VAMARPVTAIQITRACFSVGGVKFILLTSFKLPIESCRF